MARRPRLELPGIALHVIQRGNNRGPCFFEARDYRLYLDILRTGTAQFACALHAYALMTNHVHLLLTPQERHGVSRMMQWIGRRYVRAFNGRYGRSGTLWEGRFRSSMVDSERYFLICQQYIELNPVRAGIVQSPEDYLWSSHRHYALGQPDLLVTEHECYRRLGTAPGERRDAYRQFLASVPVAESIDEIRSSAQRGLPIGSEQFKDYVSNALGTPARPGKRGRPPQPVADDRQENLL